MSEKMKDRFGRTLGTKTEVGGRTQVRDGTGRILGSYDPKTNKTRDSSGRVVGTGDYSSSLITNNPKRRF